MKTKKTMFEPVTKYSYEDLITQQSQIKEPQVEVVKEVKKVIPPIEDVYIKSSEQANIKYKSKDGVVIVKGKNESTTNNVIEDIELPQKIATKLILEQELAVREEEKEDNLKKAV